MAVSERWHTKAYPAEQSVVQELVAANDFRQAVHFYELSSVFPVQPRMDIGERERRRELTMVDGVAYERVGLAARHAGFGPRLRASGGVNLPAARIWRAGLGHRPMVRRFGEWRTNPGRQRRGWRVPSTCRCPLAAVRDGVLRRYRVDRFLFLLWH